MFKEQLKKSQPVAYRILENSLLNNRYAHAYLFTGEKGTPKLETAVLLAQSILCQNGHGFACEECDTCNRIKEHNYVDCIMLDGETTSIKKNDILKIQEEFNKTAVESGGKKVYIMNYAENATPDALNSLLKFLEEPSNDVTAILIVEQIDRLLPTVISRCQRIPFKKISIEECYQACLEDAMDSLDAYLLSHLAGSISEITSMQENENYQMARQLALETIELFCQNPVMALYELQKDGFKKGNERVQFSIFIDILMLFFKDAITKKTICESDRWKEAMNKYRQKPCIHYLKVCMEAKDKCNKSVNIPLLVDQLIAKMKEMN